MIFLRKKGFLKASVFNAADQWSYADQIIAARSIYRNIEIQKYRNKERYSKKKTRSVFNAADHRSQVDQIIAARSITHRLSWEILCQKLLLRRKYKNIKIHKYRNMKIQKYRNLERYRKEIQRSPTVSSGRPSAKSYCYGGNMKI